ncbi:ribonuclease E/G [Arthrobacter sp. H5]|uniref:ribonuclease E/G n=1 Tax=Arthrobacter sp. H5 TaxID=1267973 RepID=UPI00048845DD|nr:ribonuclease E/G [Arthrobacter sp. H5]
MDISTSDSQPELDAPEPAAPAKAPRTRRKKPGNDDAQPEPTAPAKRRTSRKQADGQSEIHLPAAPSTPPTGGTPASSPVDAPASDSEAVPAETIDGGTPAKTVRKRRSTPAKAAAPAADSAGGAAADTGSAEPEQTTPVKAPRTRRPRKATSEAADPAETAAETPAADQPTSSEDSEDSEAKAKAPRARRTRKTDPVQETPAEEAATEHTGPESGDSGAKAKAPRTRRTRTAAPAQDAPAVDAVARSVETPSEPAVEDQETAAVQSFAIPESPVSLLFHAPDLTAPSRPPRISAPQGTSAPRANEQVDAEETDDENRKGRRSRRGRGRSRGAEDAERSQGEPGAEDSSEDAGDEASEENVTSRRRRRRRRGDQDLELTGGQDDDPPNTVTRVRAPRQSAEAPPSDRVTSVKGSTRLEAKKQRRRESRDTGRRRQVITEAEFLARRESVDRQMVVRQRDDRIQIAVMEDGVLAEHFVSKTQQDSLIGNVYLGKVQNVLPSMEAAFIDIGRGRNAVLYAGEVNWDAAGLDGQPRRIELALKSGDSVLVQVSKDPVGHKGARLTSQISLPGRYLVYVPGGSMTGISRKLPDVERNRLKRILKDRLPENAGVIVRTAAEGASEEELTHDINRLRSQWETIEGKSSSTKTLAPELLYGEPDLTIKVVRDVFNEDFSKLVVSGEEAWDTIEAYVMYVAPDLVGRLEKWTSGEDIFAAIRVDEQIQKALERKVFLPSGGSLVIDRTEAMTVVDVNTGKFTGSGGNLEETVTKNNLEAAEEVVRQLRLRDIGGIIVIDFIDMVLEANRDLVLRRMVECLGRDRTKHQVAEVTSLGLVQMTRKRMGTGLLEVFGENCEHCNGRGVLTHEDPVEHRRHAVSTDNHQQHLRQEKMSRSERKRSRTKSPQPAEQHGVSEPVVEDPDRAARAEAARAALANIAAATHAAHEHEDHAPLLPASTGAVLTINGETVSLPRAEHPEAVVEQPRLTLESLTEAFNRPAAQDSVPPVDGNGTPPATGARRNRGRRSASSAQGSADTATIERRTDDSPAEAARGAQHVARTQQAEPQPTTKDEPMILGVGVPASEL